VVEIQYDRRLHALNGLSKTLYQWELENNYSGVREESRTRSLRKRSMQELPASVSAAISH